MKINCELPLGLIGINNDLNEFDFVLFHLLKNPIYSSWVASQRIMHPTRTMILDNSAYEMYVRGEEINWDEFVDAINTVLPDYYILPDKIMDYEYTMRCSKQFLEMYSGKINPAVKPLAVAQGNTGEELLKSIQEFREMGVEYIGIPFHLSFFKDRNVVPALKNTFKCMGYDETDDVRYAMGRVDWVVENDEVLSSIPMVHFLGSHCPFEKYFYHKFHSMDTGYPVKLAMEGKKLGYEDRKPDILVDDYIDKSISKDQIRLIIENIDTFKSL